MFQKKVVGFKKIFLLFLLVWLWMVLLRSGQGHIDFLKWSFNLPSQLLSVNTKEWPFAHIAITSHSQRLNSGKSLGIGCCEWL